MLCQSDKRETAVAQRAFYRSFSMKEVNHVTVGEHYQACCVLRFTDAVVRAGIHENCNAEKNRPEGSNRAPKGASEAYHPSALTKRDCE